MRRVMTFLGCAGAMALCAPAAAADGGGPFAAYQGYFGASAPGGRSVYSALPVRGGTLVERFDRPTGSVLSWRVFRGNYGVPAAAGDGSTTGLSADAHRLVLAEVTGNVPPARTRLLVLNGALHMVKRIALPGAYTVDAVSPTGRWLYLIHYTSHRNLLRYEVRAYDLQAWRLLRKPVIDPREPDEAMRGSAATRVMSADGRWAYTLYLRPKGAPFVHALDTERRTAACIDVPALRGNGAPLLTLSPDGGTLGVGTTAGAEAVIDTRTFAVTRPPARRPAASRARPDHPRARNGAPAWPAGAIGLVALIALAGVARARRRRAAAA